MSNPEGSGLAEVKETFRRWDKDGRGLISTEEFMKLFKRLSPQWTDENLDNLMKQFGGANNGTVNYEDFLNWLGAGSPRTGPNSAATLRVLQVTDVYILDNFPSLRNLILEKRAELEQKRGGEGNTGSKTVSCLSGDFLMPYLLSTIDKGKGMMAMLNETPIDYLTWGNHEADLEPRSLFAREREYKGVWINTNMTSHETYPESTCQTDAAFVEVKSADGSNVRKVGMIGILTKDGYKPGAFNGAAAHIEDPWESMTRYKKALEEQDGCDLVLPLCHLYEPQDEYTAKILDFPVILSGHDHHVVNKEVNGTRILKAGADAHKCVVLDITWEHAGQCNPKIEAEVIKVADWKPDARLQEMVDKSYSVLHFLQKTQLTKVPIKFRPLSSVGARDRKCTMGTYMCSQIRDALNMDHPEDAEPVCDTCLIKAGSCPRGMRDYRDDEQPTLEMLMSEIQDFQEIVVCEVPGHVLQGGLKETWLNPNPGWMQYDDGVEVDSDGNVVTIGDEPIELDRMYKVGTVCDFWRAKDSPQIGQWFIENPDCKPEKDSGMPAHALLMQYWADLVWETIFQKLQQDEDTGSLSHEELGAVDQDNDGHLNRVELQAALKKYCGFKVHEGEYSFVDALLVAAGDYDGTGQVSVQAMNEARNSKVEKRGSNKAGKRLTTLCTSFRRQSSMGYGGGGGARRSVLEHIRSTSKEQPRTTV